MTTFGPIGTVFFSALDQRTPDNPRGYYPQFLADPDGYGKSVIDRATKCGGKILALYDIEGQESADTRYVGDPLKAPPFAWDFFLRFAADCKAANLKIMPLLRHYWCVDGMQVPMGVNCITDGLLTKYQRLRFKMGAGLYDVLAGFHYDDNYLPESTGSGAPEEAVPASVLAGFQSRIPGGPVLITTEIYRPRYDLIENVVPYRWADLQPDNPWKELAIPTKKPTGAKWMAERIAAFRNGDECAFTAHYDEPLDVANLAAWRASQAQSK